MNIVICSDYAELSAKAADILEAALKEKPNLVIGFPTGGTPVGFYEEIVKRQLDLSQATAFNLDEYIGLAADHDQSYHYYMRHHLYNHVKIGKWYVPDGTAADPAAEGERYEALIKEAGGIDLMFLGIGTNGHIGFNEPGSSFAGRTQKTPLAEATIEANARFFASKADVPTEAISMGIGTITDAKRIVLLASGPTKAAIMKATIEGPVTEEVPASVLQRHPDVTFILDKAAAAELSNE